MDPNCADDNRQFRENYRQKNIGSHYSGVLHLLYTLSFALVVATWAILQTANVNSSQLFAIPLTFFYANLVEYFMHRGPMHRPFRGLKIIYQRHATQHHIFFTDRFMQFDVTRDLKAILFPPLLIAIFLILFTIPAWIIVDWLFERNVAYLFIATLFVYFALYEVMHTVYHVSELSAIYRFKPLLRLRQLHMKHHRVDLMTRYNFNITFPIGDILFGTYYREKPQTTKPIRPITSESRDVSNSH